MNSKVSDLIVHKEIKRIARLGVRKEHAKKIVQQVDKLVHNKENLQKFIDYAVNLQYGFNIEQTNKSRKFS